MRMVRRAVGRIGGLRTSGMRCGPLGIVAREEFFGKYGRGRRRWEEGGRSAKSRFHIGGAARGGDAVGREVECLDLVVK